jgi:hypothetical protein
VIDFYCAKARLAVEVDGIGHDLGDRPQRDWLGCGRCPLPREAGEEWAVRDQKRLTRIITPRCA